MVLNWLKSLFLGTSKTSEPVKVINNLALYHFDGCMYCWAVKRQMKRLNIDFELRNIHKSDTHLKALVTNGGKQTVPCLLINKEQKKPQWMYESADIIRYLRDNYS